MSQWVESLFLTLHLWWSDTTVTERVFFELEIWSGLILGPQVSLPLP